MKFRELEKLILENGWVLKDIKGSHCNYTHPTKSGKVTIPRHGGDIAKGTLHSILKQAGIK
ncbi:MAG: type II toxin-antitoxin system HicA family toxin [Firmicutes bacterium]|nr:type II toxin-antitoxin system HicA family toxin [Bacillota bacterium]